MPTSPTCKRLALPVAGSDRTDPMWDLWLGSWIAALVVFVLVFGGMVYAMIRYRRRSDDERADPGALQPADRGAVHDRADHRGRRLLLPHRRDAERHARGGREPRPRRSPSSAASGSGRSTTSTRTPPRATTSSRSARRPTRPSCGCRSTSRCASILRSPDVIHSFWIPAFYFKLDVVPGRAELLRPDADPRGHVHRSLRRAVRALPLAHALQGPRRVAGGVRPAPVRAQGRRRRRRTRGRGRGRHRSPACENGDEN